MLSRELAPKRYHDKLILVALLLILVATSLLRIVIIMNKTTMEYDEAISYLAATCNQTRFSQASFTPLSKPASEWKQYLSLAKPFCFDQIRHDLIQSDVHPPLYFWLLHVWVMIFGVHLWTGVTLNILLAIFATLALFMLARQILRNSYEALLVVASYALNPSIVLISKEARQYDLLILLLILAVWLTHLLIKNGATWRRTAILLTAVFAAGNLTHYLFLLTVPLACFIYAIWQMANRRQGWRMLIPLLGGYGLAWALNLNFWLNINRQAERAATPTWPEFVIRLERVFVALVTFYYVLIPLLLLSPIILYFTWRHLSTTGKPYFLAEGWTIFFFLFWFGGIYIGLYLSFLTPIHTIGSSKYLSLVWPFLAFLPVFGLRFARYRRSVLLYLVLFPLLWALVLPVQLSLRRLPSPAPQLAGVEIILMDNPARGVFFPLLWHIPDRTLLITAYQEQLLAEPTNWLPYLEESTVYINVNEPPNTIEQGENLLILLAGQGYKLEQMPQQIVTITTAYNTYRLQAP